MFPVSPALCRYWFDSIGHRSCTVDPARISLSNHRYPRNAASLYGESLPQSHRSCKKILSSASCPSFFKRISLPPFLVACSCHPLYTNWFLLERHAFLLILAHCWVFIFVMLKMRLLERRKILGGGCMECFDVGHCCSLTPNQVVRLSGYQVIRLSGYQVIRLSGYRLSVIGYRLSG